MDFHICHLPLAEAPLITFREGLSSARVGTLPVSPFRTFCKNFKLRVTCKSLFVGAKLA